MVKCAAPCTALFFLRYEFPILIWPLHIRSKPHVRMLGMLSQILWIASRGRSVCWHILAIVWIMSRDSHLEAHVPGKVGRQILGQQLYPPLQDCLARPGRGRGSPKRSGSMACFFHHRCSWPTLCMILHILWYHYS